MAPGGLRRDTGPMPSRNPPAKVFLVEDSAEIRQRIGQLLTDRAITVVGESSTPQGAIDGILSSHPDVVVLDVHLKGGPGLTVLRAVRKAAPGIAFVVLSNHAGDAYRKLYLREGAAHFLDKSTEFDQLAQLVAQHTLH